MDCWSLVTAQNYLPHYKEVGIALAKAQALPHHKAQRAHQ
jgi:hypothetical protein